MSSSLGEKLRAAREQRGISISEVAEQTRISPLYLEAIDSDNYKTLPGGIFNKGFVRSYAKYVGVDEQEALQDYSRMVAEHDQIGEENHQKSYRPEVLTDDRAASSIVPTVIFAAVILGLMTAGILFLVNYIQKQQTDPLVASNIANSNTLPTANNSTVQANATTPQPPVGQAPTMDALRVEFRTSGEDIWLSSVSDGTSGSGVVSADKPMTFEPKQQLRLSYSKSLAQAAQLTINGKQITLPAVPLNPKRQIIELDLNGENLATVWQNASFAAPSTEQPQPVTEANTQNTQTPAATLPRPTPRVTAATTPKPQAEVNTGTPAAPANVPTMTGRPPARPASTPIVVGRPTSNRNSN